MTCASVSLPFSSRQGGPLEQPVSRDHRPGVEWDSRLDVEWDRRELQCHCRRLLRRKELVVDAPATSGRPLRLGARCSLEPQAKMIDFVILAYGPEREAGPARYLVRAARCLSRICSRWARLLGDLFMQMLNLLLALVEILIRRNELSAKMFSMNISSRAAHVSLPRQPQSCSGPAMAVFFWTGMISVASRRELSSAAISKSTFSKAITPATATRTGAVYGASPFHRYFRATNDSVQYITHTECFCVSVYRPMSGWSADGSDISGISQIARRSSIFHAKQEKSRRQMYCG
ncbi:hypothetical protein R3P38DRAFT_2771887 [Favolaschia claudopus]|uniref:Uncharacterized protein n=1 Tax=Favolaschia claudopus TaxID=2862362 RepID=A0AAW0C840_9AGAR